MNRRIAMWSGPRNISTAMMRAWENRSDCVVIDEPFYACYLAETGLDHPCREAVLSCQPTSRQAVIEQLECPHNVPLVYEKHMTHHMPEGCDLGWTKRVSNVFLIRSPDRVIASYLQKMPRASAHALGIVRQRQLFDEIVRITGEIPLVLDSTEVSIQPERLLRALCERLAIPWSAQMLAWPAGPRASDGVWADHWYQTVRSSTEFQADCKARPVLTSEALSLAEAMRPHYEAMSVFRLRA